MKKFLAGSLVLNAVLVAGMAWRVLIAHAARGAVPIGNGDVNADGEIDLSDAIYLISGLFMGGPPPVTIDRPPEVLRGLPATGQTKCYGRGTESPCEGGVACAGQDGSHPAGCPTGGRFVDHGDGTVTDTCTGLMWQKNTADTDGDRQIDDADKIPWCDALNYCESVTFGGHDDWRLPNVRELQSIVDYGRVNPSIDPVFGALSDYGWSSTTYVFNPEVAWRVRFDVGFVDGNNKVERHYVRAVRNAP